MNQGGKIKVSDISITNKDNIKDKPLFKTISPTIKEKQEVFLGRMIQE